MKFQNDVARTVLRDDDGAASKLLRADCALFSLTMISVVAETVSSNFGTLTADAHVEVLAREVRFIFFITDLLI
jgi:hypothetical protein